jgi:hypothetical protein
MADGAKAICMIWNESSLDQIGLLFSYFAISTPAHGVLFASECMAAVASSIFSKTEP